MAIYGVQVGVRTPAGAISYSDVDRRHELVDSAAAGAAAWGLVRWA